VESDNGLLPIFVVFLELFLVRADHAVVVLVALLMLCSVLDGVSVCKLNHQLVDCRLEQKCDKNQFVF
jgi:uncharacterized membrane protein affecting hemolysin expression